MIDKKFTKYVDILSITHSHLFEKFDHKIIN